LEATPTTLEIGIPSQGEGWLRIRAQAGGNGVHASLSSSSASGQSILREQLPAINAYLQEEHVNASANIVDKTARQPDSPGLGTGMQENRSQEERSQRELLDQSRNMKSEALDHSHTGLDQTGIGVLLASQMAQSGSCLSVMA
jgi:hypothetical protein